MSLPEHFKNSEQYSQDMEKGTLVKKDGSDNFTPTTAVGDSFTGVLLKKGETDETKPAQTHGEVGMVLADSAVSAGDELQPSGTNNGHVDVQGGGNTTVGFAIDGASSDGDYIRAFIRTPNFG